MGTLKGLPKLSGPWGLGVFASLVGAVGCFDPIIEDPGHNSGTAAAPGLDGTPVTPGLMPGGDAPGATTPANPAPPVAGIPIGTPPGAPVVTPAPPSQMFDAGAFETSDNGGETFATDGGDPASDETDGGPDAGNADAGQTSQ